MPRKIIHIDISEKERGGRVGSIVRESFKLEALSFVDPELHYLLPTRNV
jgi:hypothetical protein